MGQHTEGPWRVGYAGYTVFAPPKPDGALPERLASLGQGPLASQTLRANARLIAAAPDMLALLERATNGDELVKPWLVEVHILLARIKGEWP